MSYMSMYRITNSGSLRGRILACAAEQGKATESDGGSSLNIWVNQNIWSFATQPGWAAAWDSAEVAQNVDPGADPSVISDAMILSAVQPMS